jgi:hypothetical protein
VACSASLLGVRLRARVGRVAGIGSGRFVSCGAVVSGGAGRAHLGAPLPGRRVGRADRAVRRPDTRALRGRSGHVPSGSCPPPKHGARRQADLARTRTGGDLTVMFWATPTSSTSCSPAPASRPCAHTSPSTTWPPSPPKAPGPAVPPPLPAVDGTEAIEVDRTVNRVGVVSLGSPPTPRRRDPRRDRSPSASSPPRSPSSTPSSAPRCGPDPTRRPPTRSARLKGVRPAGPPPRPTVEPVAVQRRVSADGVVMVACQAVALGRIYAGQTVTTHATETTLTT